MRYLGIDPSLARTAVVLLADTGRVFEEDGVPDLDHVWTHYVQGPPSEYPSTTARLYAMRENMKRVLFLVDHALDLRLTAIEGYSHGSDYRSEAVAEWGGTVRLLLHELGYDFVEVAPLRLKKFATDVGKGDKDGVRMHIFKRWDFESKNNDEADAFALARYAHALGDQRGLTKKQLECFKKPAPVIVQARR